MILKIMLVLGLITCGICHDGLVMLMLFSSLCVKLNINALSVKSVLVPVVNNAGIDIYKLECGVSCPSIDGLQKSGRLLIKQVKGMNHTYRFHFL